jgi:Ala-tRNA(Pro) deacylase
MASVRGQMKIVSTNGGEMKQMTQFLTRKGVSFELLPHARTETARAEAQALGISPDRVAKTIVLVNGGGYVRAVLPASARVDLEKVRRLLHLAHKPRLATEQELAAAYPSFELGAVPPIGGPDGDRTAVDRQIAADETIVFEAGEHDESLRLKTDDLLVQALAEVGDICKS